MTVMSADPVLHLYQAVRRQQKRAATENVRWNELGLYKYPVATSLLGVFVAAPVIMLTWSVLMAWAGGWTAVLFLLLPMGFLLAPIGFVAFKLYGKTNLREACTRQLKMRPKHIDFSSPVLGVYPYRYIKTARHRDEKGVIEIRLANKTMQPTVTIAQYALCIFGKFLQDQDPELREDFLRHADALLRMQELGGKQDGGWVQRHRQEYYAPHEPEYLSAMVQSQAISVLLRAYQLTDNEAYRQAAERAMNPFEKTVAEGGVRTDYPDGKVFFEEYCLRPFYSHTLNGFIYALFGLEEMARATGHERAGYWFERGVETLARRGVLDMYDLGYISTYDQLNRKLAAMDYHRTHISQLLSLYEMTGYEVFRTTAMRWLSYTEHRRARIRLTIHLLAHKVLTGVTAHRHLAQTENTKPIEHAHPNPRNLIAGPQLDGASRLYAA